MEALDSFCNLVSRMIAVAVAAEFLDNRISKLADISDISSRQNALANGQQWFAVPLKVYGRAIPEVATRFPIANSMIGMLPGCRSAMFSVFGPGTELSPHTGVTRAVLRVLLPLRIPDGDCGMTVAGQTIQLSEGRCVVFDDYFEHSAWNRTAENRIVLFLDIDRPLRWPFYSLNRLILDSLRFHPDAQSAYQQARRAYATSG